ncbi:MAG: hypothetical protein FJ044_05640 [Candidatus Cloacimonetes bacterium]|nr:hypothetical protein [Candidatus Cloacimonadota bacterium]
MRRFFIFHFSFFIFHFSFFYFLLFTSPSFAQTERTCLVYFTGIGCPHCAKVDPLVLEKLPEKYPGLVVVEYEIYQEKQNAPLLFEYDKIYNSGLGIPLVIFDKEKSLVGGTSISQNIEKILEEKKGNPCPLIDGTSVRYEDLDISSLPGSPEIYPPIWRVYPLSGGEEGETSTKVVQQDLTLAKVISLAAVDAVNPCALAVLTLMLLGVLAYNPGDKRKVLLAGLAFSFSVFVMYFFYGLVIIRIFQVIQALTSIRLWLYKLLGVAAVVLGVLNIKDFIRYQPGSVGTEMPMFLRPKMQNLLFKITSPKGAFTLGALVTLFLLPCTIGPYIICGGILCSLSLLETLPWLFIYNAIFILPMLAITIFCFAGLTSVENVSEWRERNIRPLHLIAGVIILALGLAMVLGWV